MVNKLKIYSIAFITAFILQFFNLGTLEGSILSNIPILGEFLTGFDILATIKYFNGGVTAETTIPLFFRVVSLMATVYAVGFVVSFKLPLSIENESLYNILIICVTILVHFIFTYVIKSICLPIFDLADKAIQHINSLPIN